MCIGRDSRWLVKCKSEQWSSYGTQSKCLLGWNQPTVRGAASFMSQRGGWLYSSRWGRDYGGSRLSYECLCFRAMTLTMEIWSRKCFILEYHAWCAIVLTTLDKSDQCAKLEAVLFGWQPFLTLSFWLIFFLCSDPRKCVLPTGTIWMSVDRVRKLEGNPVQDVTYKEYHRTSGWAAETNEEQELCIRDTPCIHCPYRWCSSGETSYFQPLQ